LTETGPIASSCPKGRGLHVLPHDVFVEAAGPSGEPVPKGGTGEILVTGGRNPYLPLLRFRTGDFGRIERGRCACGDAAPRIVDLLARPAALFRSDEGVVVNPIDLARALRPFPIVQHQFLQRKDRSCRLAVKLPPGPGRLDPSDLEKALRRFLGPGLDISVVFDPELGKGSRSWKVHSYLSELPLAPDRT
ncbi:MAG: hypothetical protein HY924_07035, partial [Elusimicrobia bacterium]|nr:hypothetical protein [Elusimicrobiota bacterium]